MTSSYREALAECRQQQKTILDALALLLRDYEQLWSDSTDDEYGECVDESYLTAKRTLERFGRPT